MKHPPAFWIVAICAFLAPIIGGGIIIDPIPVTGGMLASLFGDASGTGLSFGLLGLLSGLAVVSSVAGGRVTNLPKPKILIPVSVFFLLLWGSVGFSEFRLLSLQSALVWTSLGLLLLATLMVSGISTGPRVLLSCLMAGITFAALWGIREYALLRETEHRIFSTWFHPNALAGILLFGILLGPGLAFGADRVPAMVAYLGSALCFTALMLTGSKGGLYALVPGILLALLALVAWCPKVGWKTGAGLLVAIVLGFGFSAALRSRISAPGTGSGGLSARVSASDSTAAQSFTFRKLLWQTSIKVMQESPAGTGAGTFRYQSARAGLTTQTHTAHNSFLQLGVEAGPAAMVFFLLGIGAVLLEGFRGVRKQPVTTQIVKASLLGAIGASLSHNMIDSDLSHMGIGIALALCFGVWISLSNDAIIPEFSRPPVRPILLIVPCITGVLLLYLGYLDYLHAELQASFQRMDTQGINAKLAEIKSISPPDGRVAQFEALWATRDGSAPQVSLQQRAVDLAPTPANYRALARAQSLNHDPDAARFSYRKALRLDPNNLLALRQWMLMEIRLDEVMAKRVASRLVAVEKKPYFTVRALAELVPMETIEGRRYLASHEPDPAKARDLYEGALDLYKDYANLTLNQVVEIVKKGGTEYAGITPRQGEDTLGEAKEMVQQYLAKGGDPAKAKDYSGVFDLWAASLAKVSK